MCKLSFQGRNDRCETLSESLRGDANTCSQQTESKKRTPLLKASVLSKNVGMLGWLPMRACEQKRVFSVCACVRACVSVSTPAPAEEPRGAAIRSPLMR